MNIHQQYDVHPNNGQHRSFFIQIFSYAGALKNDYLARPVGQFGNLISRQSSGKGSDIFVHCYEIITY